MVGRKVYFVVDCRGASVIDGVGCCARWWSSRAAFSFQGGSPPVALDVHLEDGRVVDEPVDHGQGHGWVGEDLAPLTERLVCGDEDGAAFVARADELEQHAGLGLILADVGEVVEDQEVEALEPVDGGLEGEFAAGDLELLDEVGGPGEQDPRSVVNQGEADGCGEMAFSAAGWAEEEQVGALANQLSPAVMAITCALESIGTASKSKLSSVFPGGRRASARWRSIRLRPRSASSCSATAARQRAAGHPSLSACSATCDHTSLMAGRRNSLSRRLMRAVSTAWVVFMPPLPCGRSRQDPRRR